MLDITLSKYREIDTAMQALFDANLDSFEFTSMQRSLVGEDRYVIKLELLSNHGDILWIIPTVEVAQAAYHELRTWFQAPYAAQFLERRVDRLWDSEELRIACGG